MRVKSLLAAMLVLVLSAAANADVIITSTRDTQVNSGTGQPTGREIIRFYAKLTPTGTNYGTTLKGEDVVMTTDAETGFVFRFSDIDGDDTGDASGDPAFQEPDIIGRGFKNLSQFTSNTNLSLGTALRPMGVATLGIDPNLYTVVDSSVSPRPYTSNGVANSARNAYTNVKSFRVAGAYTGPAQDATTGNGQIFAIAVVPAGATVTLKAGGNVGGDNASAPPYVFPQDIVNAVPEPGSIGLLGLGLIGLLARRRRNA